MQKPADFFNRDEGDKGDEKRTKLHGFISLVSPSSLLIPALRPRDSAVKIYK